MAKTRRAIAFDSLARDAYCDKQSQISINRAFAEKLVRMLPAESPEAEQLRLRIEQNKDRIKTRQFDDTLNRPLIS